MVRRGPAVVRNLIENHDIRCNYCATGHLSIATTPEDVAALEQDAAFFARLKIPMTVLGRAATRDAMGSDRFLGSLRQDDGGTVNPFAYTNGMARAAVNLGARAYAHSRVRSIAREGRKWRLRTAEGSVLCDTVCICTSGYTTNVSPAVFKSFYPFLLAAISFRPLPAAVSKTVIPSAACVYEVGLPGAILRDVTGRLYFSSATSPFKPDSDALFANILRSWLRLTYPSLETQALEVEGYWTGWEAFTLDSLPRIYSPAPGIFAPMCFNGVGITTCTQFGSALANAIATGDRRELPVPLTKPRRFHGRSIFRLAAGLYITRALDRCSRRFAATQRVSSGRSSRL
jgi:glycine/D-amino acid oxidase-like deaminating enzyme